MSKRTRRAIPKENKFFRLREKVEAFRWSGTQEGYPFAMMFIEGYGKGDLAANGSIDLVFPTENGELRAQAGDWVVKEPDNFFHPVKHYIFERQYGPVFNDHKPKAEEE